MKRQLQPLAAMTLVLSFCVLTLAGEKESAQPMPFAVATVRFEQNATDGDVEVLFEAKGGDKGLAKLTVVSPDGRTVIDFKASDPSTLGIRSFRFESPEPKDVEGLKAAYPKGVYRFAGATEAGEQFLGEATLNHKLPATVAFLNPTPEAEDVMTENLTISWTPVKNLANYLVVIEQEEQGLSITAKVAGSASSFAVPEGFLQPGTEYKIAVGTITAEGNMSIVETTFVTAGKD